MIQQAPNRLTNVVVWVDYSDACPECIRRGADAAEAAGATLHLVHVCMPPWKIIHYRAPSTGTDPAYQERFARVQEHRLKHFARRQLRGRTLSVVYAVFFGSEASVLVAAYAERVRAELVIAHGHHHHGILGPLWELADGTFYLRRSVHGQVRMVED
jgi:hypothetical protein